MGTYCYYRLGIINKHHGVLIGEKKREMIQKLFDDPDVDKFEAEWSLTPDGDSADESKWPHYEEELTKFCKKHPDYFFILGMELCEPECEEEEGEIYILFSTAQCGTLRDTPVFMRKGKLFKDVVELENAMLKDNHSNTIEFHLHSNSVCDIELWKYKMEQTQFKEHLKESFSFSSSTGRDFKLAITIKSSETDEFWSEAKRVLIQ